MKILKTILTPDEIEIVRKIINNEVELEDYNELYDKLFQYYLPDIPYGTAKGRTGDSYEWIFQELCKTI